MIASVAMAAGVGAGGASAAELDRITIGTNPAGTLYNTMGAGDAFFAVTALFAKDSAMPELLRIGNAAAALKCQILGHRAAVTKGDLIAYLETH